MKRIRFATETIKPLSYYEDRSETKLADSTRLLVIPVRLVVYRVRRVDFSDRLVVNWSYSSRRRRVRLFDSRVRLVVIRLAPTEFVSSNRETRHSSSTRQVPSSTRRPLGPNLSARCVLAARDGALVLPSIEAR